MGRCVVLLLALGAAVGGCGFGRIADAVCSAAAFGFTTGCDTGSTSLVAGAPRVDVVDGSGRLSLFSDGTRGTGPAFANPTGIVIDAARDRAVVCDTTKGWLVAVDLATGNRSVVASATVGSGPALTGPLEIAYDAAGDRLFVLSLVLETLFVVDAETGDRSALSSPSLGGGADFAVGAIAWDGGDGCVVMVAEERDALYAVDGGSGARRVISDLGRGQGPPFDAMRGVAVDASRRIAYVSDVGLDALVAVDLATGDRVIVAGPGTGSGPSLGNVPFFVLGSDLEHAYLVDWDSDRLLRVDLATGNRTVLSSEGLAGRTPWSMALSPSRNRLYVTRY